ncbi:MAG TPA: hypothetical protein VFZ51_08450 [Woeseiaceae bacterium]
MGIAVPFTACRCDGKVDDPDVGQLVTGSRMDYAMPRADCLPNRIRYRQVPSPRNPLCVKGAGEAGTVGAAPALVDASLDALAPRGIGHGHAACTVVGPAELSKARHPTT